MYFVIKCFRNVLKKTTPNHKPPVIGYKINSKGMSIYKWDEESPDNRTSYPNISTAYKIKPKVYYLKRNWKLYRRHIKSSCKKLIITPLKP